MQISKILKCEINPQNSSCGHLCRSKRVGSMSGRWRQSYSLHKRAETAGRWTGCVIMMHFRNLHKILADPHMWHWRMKAKGSRRAQEYVMASLPAKCVFLFSYFWVKAQTMLVWSHWNTLKLERRILQRDWCTSCYLCLIKIIIIITI